MYNSEKSLNTLPLRREQTRQMEVNGLNGKNKALALFSVIAIAAIISGILLAPQMVNATETDDKSLTTQTSDTTDTTAEETTDAVLANWNHLVRRL